MSHPESIRDIVRYGLCTGCGLCESLGGDRLPMKVNAEGHLRPDVSGGVDPEVEREVLAACPGLNQSGTGAPRRSAIWGPYESVTLGHARDEGLRFAASSGGVTSAAASFLLERGVADVVLHVAPDPERPMRSVACASRSPEEVRDRVGARYGPAGPLAPLHALLDGGERIAVVAKPCDIAAVRNLARRDPRVNEQVLALVTFFCAGLPGLRVSENIVGKYGLVEDEVAQLRYRGQGCPGPTRIEAADGRVWEQTYQETWSSELTQGIQFRCKICPDSTGEQADLVCGDAWDGGEGNPLDDSAGHNVVLARTARGQRLLDEMRAAERVELEPLALEQMAAMQPHQARRKSQVLARLAGLRVAGQPVPRFRGLGLWRAAFSGLGALGSNLRGMVRRVKRGNNREHLPGAAETSNRETRAT
ncbi:coenzyme F420 hydrogenase [Aquicoccus sp. SCR17]|nr:coenzyme F420 hydrogenase [Carideicomes alvinocaridis]